MKIALVSFLFDTETGGGAGSVVQNLASSLHDLGFDVIVITTHGNRHLEVSNSGGIRFYKFLPWNLYWVAEKDQHPLYKKFLWQLVDIWNPQVFWKVKQILEKEQPDVVHIHKLRGLSPSVWAAAHAAGCRKIVQTCHDHELMSPEGTLNGRIGQMAEQGHRAIQPYQTARAQFSRRVDLATAPSTYLMEMLTSRSFFPRAKQLIIPNTHGMNDTQLAEVREQNRHKPPANTVRFLYIGRLEEIKGVDDLCAAFAACANQYSNVTLDIAGWGTQEEMLRQKYEQHPRITFHGAVFGDRKLELLAGITVMVVPSTRPESFGIVVTEGFAFGKPVIVSAIGALPELVQNGVTGFHFPPGNRLVLLEHLSTFAVEPQLAQEMSDACFREAVKYSSERITGKYLKAYASL